jgi:hypothetical protein
MSGGKKENEIMGTVLSRFKSPDSRFTEEQIVVFYDGAFNVVNWALARSDGLWHVGMSFVFGDRTLEAIKRINPSKFTGPARRF